MLGMCALVSARVCPHAGLLVSVAATGSPWAVTNSVFAWVFMYGAEVLMSEE